MNIDIVEISDFFKEPEKMRNLALAQEFYSVKENPHDSFQDTELFYWGKRTQSLTKILDERTNGMIMKQFFDKVFQVVTPPKAKGIQFELNCLFHSLSDIDRIGPRDLHKDSSLYAGVVYLYDVPMSNPEHFGTVIIKDHEKIMVPYEYNKLVLYRGDYLHSAQSGFGDKIENSRLTFNIFFNIHSVDKPEI